MRIQSNRYLAMAMLMGGLAFGGVSCKSGKKAAEAAAAAEKAKMEQEAEAKRKAAEEEAARKQREAEEARLAAERAAKDREANTPENRLRRYFEAIAGASNPSSANSTISEALGLFNSPETPVLIVISEEGGEVDYDRPTTAGKYLNYLKDQKAKPSKIKKVVLDGAGKIKELELVK